MGAGLIFYVMHRNAPFLLLVSLLACHGRPSPTAAEPAAQPPSGISDSTPVRRFADSVARRPASRFVVDTTQSPEQRFLQVVIIRLGQGLDVLHDVEHITKMGSFHAAVRPVDDKWGDEMLSAFVILHSMFALDSVPGEAVRTRRIVDSLRTVASYPSPSVVWKALAEHNRRTLTIFDRLEPRLKDDGIKKLAAVLRAERLREIAAFEAEAARASR